jgi:2-polyprenyl-6-methoxyphenol hydroxylase-like FAD-dependent oxidoreductase
MTARFDYAVVGGGPAGLAVAILGALAGRKSVVLERGEGAVDKACGEGVMPPGVAWLARMGVEVAPDGCAPFRGIRYVDGEVSAEAEFIEGPGLGIRRTALSAAMQERAAALGVDLRQGCEAGSFTAGDDRVLLQTTRGEVEARWLIGADGLHGRVRAACGFRVTTGSRRRFGVRRHFAISPWSDHVEVHWADGVEAYVTPVGPRRVGIAFLWSSSGGQKGDYDAFLRRFPDLAARLAGAVADPETEARGAGPFDVRVRPITSGRVLLVGDATGYLDAITGEGLSLAFASAAALVEATTGDDPASYVMAWERIRRQHLSVTRFVLWLADHPALRGRVVRALRRSPDAFQAFLALNTGAWGWGRALPGVGKLGLRLIAARGYSGSSARYLSERRSSGRGPAGRSGTGRRPRPGSLPR